MTDSHDFDPGFPDEQNRPRPNAAKRALARLDRFLKREQRKGGGFWGFVKWAAIIAILGPLVWVMAYRFIEAPGTILMVQRSMAGQTVQRDTVSLDNISPHLVRAVIAAEDAKFCVHNGFDTDAIQKALKSNAKSKKVRGGSTISQQTAKNLFLWPQRDWIRKGLEAYFTGLIDYAHLWPKRRIMEAYLNAAEWGDGLFGAEAAAQSRFGVSAKDLSPRQAALLAAVLPSPNKWRAVNPGPYVRRRAASIEARMWVVRNQGLDLCVLEPGAAPPPRPRGEEPEDVLPPLVELPPTSEDDLGVADVHTEDMELIRAAPLENNGEPTSEEPAVEPDSAGESASPAPAPPADASEGGAPMNVAP